MTPLIIAIVGSAVLIAISIHQLKVIIAMKSADTTTALQNIDTTLGTVGAQLVKGLGEVTTEVAALQDSIGGTTPEQDAIIQRINDKMTALAGTAQALDDMNKDADTTGGAGPAVG